MRRFQSHSPTLPARTVISNRAALSRNVSSALRCARPRATLSARRSKREIVRGREAVLAAVVELQQAEGLAGGPQGDQGHRFVAFAVAAVAGAGLPIGLASCWPRAALVELVQKLPRAVKKGLAGSKRPRSTLPHMHSRTGLPSLSRCSLAFRVDRAQAVLGQDEFGRETAGLEIGEVLALAEPNADRLAARPLLQQGRHRAYQLAATVPLVEQASSAIVISRSDSDSFALVMSRAIVEAPTMFP